MGKDTFESYSLLARSRAGMASLWRGADHLLYVRGSGFLLPFTEEYKRYRFEDIQSVSIAKRSRWAKGLLWGMGFAFSGLILALILGLSDRESFGVGTAIFVSLFALSALAFLSALIRHLVLGPPCFCDIQTSLSRDRLRPLDRYHLSREIFEKLDGEIREGQSSLLEKVATEEVPSKEMSKRHRAGGWHVPWPILPTFAIALTFGLTGLLGLHLDSLAPVIAALFQFFALSLLLILSLVISVRKATPQDLRSWLWGLLGMVFFFSGVAVVYLFLASARDPIYTLDFAGPFEAFLAVATEGGWIFYSVFVASFALILLCGTVGTLISLKWRKQIAASRQIQEDEEVVDG